RKFIPGKLSVHIINTIVIPRIQYRLQLVPVSQTTVKTINNSFKSITKEKMHLPRSTPDSSLYWNAFGIKLINMEQSIIQKSFNDMSSWMLRPNIHRDCIMAIADKTTQKLKWPINILYKPPPLTQKQSYSNFITFLSFNLKTLDMSVTATN